jgi:hypothetical protein
MTLQSVTGGADCTAPLPVAFHRLELGVILDLYSRRVSAGEWRDYAIDQMPGRAVFSIFRRAMEGPVFTITKWSDGSWEICHGPRSLMQTDSLSKALAVFQRDLRLV